MNILWFNFYWMAFNIILALIALAAGLVMYKTHNKFVKYAAAFVWLIFIPNTIYLYTDIIHIPEQFHLLGFAGQLILLIQYITLLIVGTYTFVISLNLFDKTFLNSKKLRAKRDFIFLALNFLIAFGIVLGRVQRTNSWEVFTNPLLVLEHAFVTITSPDLLLLTLFFGAVCNATYFIFRDMKTFNWKS